jgi:PAS domain S-box-containing protein
MSSGGETGTESASDALASKAVIELIMAFDQRIAHTSFPEIARGALAFLAEQKEIARASVALLMGDKGPFRIFDSTGEIRGVESGALVPAAETSLWAVVERGESIYRRHLDDRPNRNPVDKALFSAGFHSTFSTPLFCAGRCIGTLNAAATSADGLGPVTRRLIELLAPRLAFGIHASIIHDQLRESEARFRDVFATVGDGILVADIGTRRLVMANPAICKLLGRSPDELLGSTIDLIHPPEQFDEVLRTFVAMLEGRIDHALGIPMLRSDGTVVSVDVTARSTTLSGQPCMVGAFRDASARREREQEQVQMQKLESIRTLAAGIAHDFNNLLTGLVGNMSLVQAHVEEGSEAREWLAEAQRAAVRATGLTRQLLTFARGGAPIRRAIDVVPVVRDSANLACAGTNVCCTFQLTEQKIIVLGDDGQLAQVVQNLVRNAVDAMPGGGTVEIRARVDSRGTEQRSPEVCIEVVDHGVGIRPEVLDRIFVPFFTTKSGGSGLGLAVAYSVVQSHGGRINVSSVPGNGTTFQVFLPLTEHAAPSEPTDVTAKAGQGRILIMDDQDVVRRVAERILMQAGYTTHAVANGSEAVDAYRKAWAGNARFDAAILDLTVPGAMGGREAAAIILAVDPKARLIVSSGYSDEAEMSAHAEHGFQAVLPKPYNATQLLSTVGSLLRPDNG